jgi:hypothetical protein
VTTCRVPTCPMYSTIFSPVDITGETVRLHFAPDIVRVHNALNFTGCTRIEQEHIANCSFGEMWALRKGVNEIVS